MTTIPSQSVTINPCTATTVIAHAGIIIALATIAAIGAWTLYNGSHLGTVLLCTGGLGGLVEVAILYCKRSRTFSLPMQQREGQIKPTTRYTCCAERFVNGREAPNPLWNTIENILLMPLGGFRKYVPSPKEKKEVFGPSPIGPLEGKIDIRWMGHASFLIRTENCTILTDPNWSETISSACGIPLYYRAIKAGLRFKKVQTITHLLLSHTHADHFDLITLLKFWQRDHPRIFCPLKADQLLEGFTNVTPLNWWEKKTLSKNVSITFVPATHASQTTALDCNEYLWGGYIINIDGYKIYFMGDSAWNINPNIKGFVPCYWEDNVKKFQDIFEGKGPFDVVICGIDPIDGQENMHANLCQLADLFNRLEKPPIIIPMHWGTWPFDKWGADITAPMEHFRNEMNQYPNLKDSLKQMKVGERITLLPTDHEL